MKQVVRTYWHKVIGGNGVIIPEGERKSITIGENGGGYKDAEDMTRDLMARFKHRHPVRIPGGVRLEGDGGTYQEVTMEDD